MDINQLLQDYDLISIFIKAIAVIFDVLFLFYAIIITKQTQVMNSTLTVGRSGLITFISFLHIILAIVLIVLAFTIL
jgi:hypothetical protein